MIKIFNPKVINNFSLWQVTSGDYANWKTADDCDESEGDETALLSTQYCNDADAALEQVLKEAASPDLKKKNVILETALGLARRIRLVRKITRLQ